MIYLIVLFILFIVMFVVAVRSKKIVELSAIALSLVSYAEVEWGNKTGDIKFSDVYTKLCEFIPLWLRPLISEDLIKNIIEKAKQEMDKIISSQIDFVKVKSNE